MKREMSQRWVLSFADLALLLLAFFVMMQAQVSDRLKLAAGIRGAFGGSGEGSGTDGAVTGFAAANIFEGGEAILKPGAAAQLKAIGAQAAKAGKGVIVASQGRDAGSARLDSWELSAARTAAVARAIRAGGMRDAMIEIAIPPIGPNDSAKGQKISIERTGGRSAPPPHS